MNVKRYFMKLIYIITLCDACHRNDAAKYIVLFKKLKNLLYEKEHGKHG
jgi:hypothetical protein